jgi:hypothetical protein
MYNALDAHLLSSTQWNYTASNRNDPMVGDGWNQEDLSVWSLDQFDETDPQSGGRAVAGFSRPYVRAAQGSLLRQYFDRDTATFEATIDCNPDCPATEIVLPPVHYPAGVSMEVDGQPVLPTAEEKLLIYRSANKGTLTISVWPMPVEDPVHDAQPAKASPAR